MAAPAGPAFGNTHPHPYSVPDTLPMTSLALALILIAATMHAMWNLLLKRSGGGVVFVWGFTTLAAILYAPVAAALVWWVKPHITWVEVALMLASAIFNTGYFLLLDRAYRNGDMSLVYPLVRGTGPLITVVFAVLLLHERPSAMAVIGILLIVSGSVILTGDVAAIRRPGYPRAVGSALIAASMVAGYTLIDKSAVSIFLVPAILQEWVPDVGRALMLTPLAIKRRAQIPLLFRSRRKMLLAVAIAALSPLSYILILTAMVFTPVSYVAPAREISILIGTVLGTRLLAEAQGPRRLGAAAVMVGGVVLLAVG